MRKGQLLFLLKKWKNLKKILAILLHRCYYIKRTFMLRKEEEQ